MQISSSWTCLFFTAEWCGSCQNLYPVVEKIEDEFQDRLEFIKIDIDKHPSFVHRFKISSVPTLLLYCNGKEIWRRANLLTTAEFRSLLNRYLSDSL